MDTTTLKAIVEATIFAAEEPVTPGQLAEVLGIEQPELDAVLEELKGEYEQPGRGLRLTRVAGGLRFMTRPDYHPWIKLLFKNQRSVRLSQAALQTLAIIAYKQPVTGPEIEAIRNVDPGGILKNLLDKRLVKVLGRKDVVGRPLLYGTTREFLLQFGLKDLSELPRMEELDELVQAELGLEQPEEELQPAAGNGEPAEPADGLPERQGAGSDEEE